MTRMLARTQNVSIRAPAWGATDFFVRAESLGAVSIRAPAWGATKQADIEKR